MIGVFNQGMHHALPVHHDVDVLRVHVEQPPGLDELQPLVHHGGGIDGDFRPHTPVGMPQSVLHRHPFQFGGAFAEKGAAGGGKDQALQGPFPGRPALQALEYGGMFAVHRQKLHSSAGDGVHDQRAAGHQGFLIGQGDVVPRPYGGQGGQQPHHAHHRVEHHVSLRQGRQLAQALHAGRYPHRQIPHPHL